MFAGELASKAVPHDFQNFLKRVIVLYRMELCGNHHEKVLCSDGIKIRPQIDRYCDSDRNIGCTAVKIFCVNTPDVNRYKVFVDRDSVLSADIFQFRSIHISMHYTELAIAEQFAFNAVCFLGFISFLGDLFIIF